MEMKKAKITQLRNNNIYDWEKSLYNIYENG